MGPGATARRSGGAADSISARAQVPPPLAAWPPARELAPELAPAWAFFPRPRSPEALPPKEVYPPECQALAASLHGKESLPTRSTFSGRQGVTLSVHVPDFPGVVPAAPALR